MLNWTIVVPAFLTAAVEWVEAFTIVLAVSVRQVHRLLSRPPPRPQP